ncbi:MAG: DUF1343 domain-containing protein [Bacteroidetes bacterium]|nr:MAG: DUF1343 domain-containing protein [Bacteroidota bacterium]
MTRFEYKKISLLTISLILINTYFIHAQIITGAQQLNKYLPLLKNKRVGLVVNQTSTINNTHLVDTLGKLNVKLVNIFAPEHGFRGDHSAGAKVKSSVDAKTGIPVISLYGKNYKPSVAAMQGLDVVIFDIQDVGVRFYTYISTLHYVMEACAEQQKLLIVLDRPNPNGYYVDGPVLDTAFKSFVGMHPVPIVHGLTIGEYAKMINGQGWLKKGIECPLTVISMKGYTHRYKYHLPIKPSPNLPTAESIALYPSVCLFEGTNYSVGRGTDKPFEFIGSPGCTVGDFTFTPRSIKGVAENPPHANKKCRGYLLTDFATNVHPIKPQLHISWLIELYQQDTAKSRFFIPFFNQLAGNNVLQEQIKQGVSEDEIRKSWEPALNAYKRLRKKYMLYPDFDNHTQKPQE